MNKLIYLNKQCYKKHNFLYSFCFVQLYYDFYTITGFKKYWSYLRLKIYNLFNLYIFNEIHS
jgi:hypothetical protein